MHHVLAQMTKVRFKWYQKYVCKNFIYTVVIGSIKETHEQSFEYDDQTRIQSSEEFQTSKLKNVKKRKIPFQIKLENIVAGSILTSDKPDLSIHNQGIHI